MIDFCWLRRRRLFLFLLIATFLTSSTDASVLERGSLIRESSERLPHAFRNARKRWSSIELRPLQELLLANTVRQGSASAHGSELANPIPVREEAGDTEDGGTDELSADGSNEIVEGAVDSAAGDGKDSASDPTADSAAEGEVAVDKTAAANGEDGAEQLESKTADDGDEDAEAETGEQKEKASLETHHDDKGKEQAESGTIEGEESTGNITDPFDTFMLMQMVELPSDDGFEMVTVYEHGSFVGPFANNPNTSSTVIPSDQDDESWYADSEYVDRIAFQFTYQPIPEMYAISKPIVDAGTSRGVLPIIEDFKNDGSLGGGSFTILYRCQRDAEQISRISLKMQVTVDQYIQTTWSKKCGNGRYEHIEFGFTAHDHSVTLFNADGTFGKEEQRTLEVGPLETSTELSMKLAAPAQNLQFAAPYVSSGSENVSVQLRGTISDGTLSSDSATIFSILYECKSATSATIDFTLEIPPWDNITAQWRKDCGGSHSQALLIGTTGKNSYDVMQDGELAPLFNVTDETSLDDANGVISVIPTDVDTKRFYLTNSDDTSDIHIQTITTTMSNPKVLTVTVGTPIIGTSYIPSTGDVIRRHETKSLFLHFVCKREGKSLVLVTLPTLRYKNVEFGFVKECDEPKVYHHSGFLQTASSLMGTFLTLGILAAIGTFLYIRRRQGAKYSAVPTNESMIP